MSSYSSRERIIAAFLSKFPGLKQRIKKIYQRLNYLIYKNNYDHKSLYPLKKYEFNNQETFFGYYDKSPLNEAGTHVVFQSTSYNSEKKTSPNIAIDIILHNVKENKSIKIGETKAWNWQQGAKLQWLDNEEFVFNTFDGEKYISSIWSINENKIVKNIDSAIYDTHKDFALSLNFDRLCILGPDYSYKNNKENIKLDDFPYNEDGIFLIDLKNNKKKLLISFEDIIKKYISKKIIKNTKHKVNHIMICPDGQKFMFIHRRYIKGVKFDSLFVANIDGTELKLISNDDMVSHCFWFDNENIFGYLRDRRHGDKYYMINIENAENEIIGEGIIDIYGDGHPNILENKVLFDTYPDKARMKKLFVFDMKTKENIELGEFFESIKYFGESRCDLHARWAVDGKSIFFDSVHEGKRRMYSMNLDSNYEL